MTLSSVFVSFVPTNTCGIPGICCGLYFTTLNSSSLLCIQMENANVLDINIRKLFYPNERRCNKSTITNFTA